MYACRIAMLKAASGVLESAAKLPPDRLLTATPDEKQNTVWFRSGTQEQLATCQNCLRCCHLFLCCIRSMCVPGAPSPAAFPSVFIRLYRANNDTSYQIMAYSGIFPTVTGIQSDLVWARCTLPTHTSLPSLLFPTTDSCSIQ